MLVASSVFLIATHAALIGYKDFANVDESYAMALAQRVLDGHALYHEAISQRGPLMYYAYAFIAKTGGWDNVVNLRLWALGFAFLHVGLVYWGALRLLSRRAAIVVVFALHSFEAFAFGLAHAARVVVAVVRLHDGEGGDGQELHGGCGGRRGGACRVRAL